MNHIFGKIKRSGAGNHKSKSHGIGDEHTGDFRNYQFGDALDNVSITESIRNAQINNGIDDFNLTENDLVVEETLAQESNEHRFDDRYQSLDDFIRRRSNYTC